MGLGNINPGCCDCLGDGCPNCFNNDAPATFQVTFSGIADDTCTGSSTFNSTWNVSRSGAASSCSYLYFLSDAEAAGLELTIAPCGCEAYIGGGGGDSVSIAISVTDAGGGNYDITVKIGMSWRGLHGCPDLTPPFVRYYTFKKTYTGKPHCIELVDESIPYDSATAVGYDASGATCLLTAV